MRPRASMTRVPSGAVRPVADLLDFSVGDQHVAGDEIGRVFRGDAGVGDEECHGRGEFWRDTREIQAPGAAKRTSATEILSPLHPKSHWQNNWVFHPIVTRGLAGECHFMQIGITTDSPEHQTNMKTKLRQLPTSIKSQFGISMLLFLSSVTFAGAAAPEIICQPEATVSCGVPFTYSAAVSDSDGDAVQATWTLNGVAVETDNIAAGGPPSFGDGHLYRHSARWRQHPVGHRQGQLRQRHHLHLHHHRRGYSRSSHRRSNGQSQNPVATESQDGPGAGRCQRSSMTAARPRGKSCR